MIKKNINPRNFLSYGIAFLFILFILVMLSSRVESILMDYTGIKDKPKLLEFIGLGMSGFIATLGVIGLLKRAAAVDEQNKLTETGHLHERFKAATEHLGNEKSASIRIASFNEFYRLAEITNEKALRGTIFNILCAHLRQTTKDGYDTKGNPTEEVQSLLDILFKLRNVNMLIFGGLSANLAETNLQGADLQKAYLNGENRRTVILKKYAYGANLQVANLQGADMRGANLEGVNLRRADMRGANLQGAYMQEVYMRGADMRWANLRGTDMRETDLQDADLRETDLQDADLQDAKIDQNAIATMPSGWQKKVKKHKHPELGEIAFVRLYEGDEFKNYI